MVVTLGGGEVLEEARLEGLGAQEIGAVVVRDGELVPDVAPGKGLRAGR